MICSQFVDIEKCIAQPFNDGDITVSTNGMNIKVSCNINVKKGTIKNILHHYLEKMKYLDSLKIRASANDTKAYELISL